MAFLRTAHHLILTNHYFEISLLIFGCTRKEPASGHFHLWFVNKFIYVYCFSLMKAAYLIFACWLLLSRYYSDNNANNECSVTHLPCFIFRLSLFKSVYLTHLLALNHIQCSSCDLPLRREANLMFIGPCIILIVE